MLPALVLALAGAGMLWLASRPAVPTSAVDRARRPLLDARRALLAHVSAYPESYGPTGAGPGHLPCPDTDTPLARPTRAGQGSREGEGAASGFRGDGPDPPCGGGAVAVGRLPRHVSLPSHRELFHHEATQRLVYAVSGAFVNNPLDRLVGPAADDVPRVPPSHGIVAVIIDAGEASLPGTALVGARDPWHAFALVRAALAESGGTSGAVRPEHVFVRRDELLAASARRVGAWFVERATRVARERCAAALDADGIAGAPGCATWPHGDAPCDTSAGARALAWVADDMPRGNAGTIAGTGAGTDAGAAAVPGIDAATAQARTVCTSAEQPDASPPAPVTIENAPRERHWFVRNGWHRAVSVAVDASCRDAVVACALRPRRAARGSDPLTLALVPAEPAAPPVTPPRGTR